MASRRAIVALAALACAVGLGVLGLVRTAGRGDLPPGGDFTLVSAEGPLALHDLRGKAVLVFFGYLDCPGACPTALATHAAALRLLRPQERERVVGLFISVDPARDTPEAMRDVLRNFDPSFRGATGKPEDLRALAARYGVLYELHAPDASGRYAVDHTTDTILVGPEGRPAARIPLDTPPESLAVELRRALR